MNTQILKLRYWDGKKMYYPHQDEMLKMYWNKTIGSHVYQSLWDKELKYCDAEDKELDGVLMLCTGKKDKRGNTIFRGDILKDNTTGNLKEVKWDDDFCAFILRVLKEDTTQWLAILSDVMPHEVVGNIYENPELITA